MGQLVTLRINDDILTVLADLDILTVDVLVAGDLAERLGLGDTLLLDINPAEVLGHCLEHPLALDGGIVVAGVKVSVTRDQVYSSFLLEL